jgi:hypothetical protein
MRIFRELGTVPGAVVTVASVTETPVASPRSNPKARSQHPNSPWKERLGKPRHGPDGFSAPYASRWYGGRKYNCIPVFVRYEDATGGAGEPGGIIQRAVFRYGIGIGTVLLFDQMNPERFRTCSEAREAAEELGVDIDKLGLSAGTDAFMARRDWE